MNNLNIKKPINHKLLYKVNNQKKKYYNYKQTYLLFMVYNLIMFKFFLCQVH